jgi:hypothetical protein
VENGTRSGSGFVGLKWSGIGEKREWSGTRGKLLETDWNRMEIENICVAELDPEGNLVERCWNRRLAVIVGVDFPD